MTLIHRQPNMQFEGVPGHWCNNIEFGAFFLAGSTGTPAVEPFLNQVLAQAKAKLPPQHRHLEDDIDNFVKQETEHYKIHNAYNAEIFKSYPFLREGYEAKRADYRQFLASKSHKFNCAYSAAFETLALSLAVFLFEETDEYLEGADERTLNMWKWHLAEEYEHRSVCHKVYQAIYGDYFYRVKSIIFAYRHLGGHNKRIYQQIMEHERADMTPAERKLSLERERKFRRKLIAFQLPKVLKLFTPRYDPSPAKVPAGAQAILDHYALASM
ncbi:metal-dependent hydrolase [Sphingobium sp. V4]|uniref:metal-dependent hydrolase n=1 Tax=Sphingobium sp. V4 TaxID=3038927 RepID=UPI00255802FA|nr:metal-dependent hydrolase [Sphingobium sp. V4]WIW89480.1 metal-dependent hydrolase [Sphingobium sp. V4]